MTRLCTGLLGIGVAFALVGTPAAGALTWAYQGEIEDVATQINGTFSVGQTWSGTFTFDPSTPDTAITNTSLGVYGDAVSAHVFAVPSTWGGSGAGETSRSAPAAA